VSKAKGKNLAKGKRTGRPPRAFTREEIDDAVRLIGLEVYPSRVAGRLKEKHPSLGRELCYRLIDEARSELVADIAGTTGNPIAQLYASYLAVYTNPKSCDVVKLGALNGASKLLGLDKLIRGVQESGSIEAYLAGVLARQTARVGQQTAPTEPPTEPK
jgi:hypothetical protein